MMSASPLALWDGQDYLCNHLGSPVWETIQVQTDRGLLSVNYYMLKELLPKVAQYVSYFDGDLDTRAITHHICESIHTGISHQHILATVDKVFHLINRNDNAVESFKIELSQSFESLMEKDLVYTPQYMGLLKCRRAFRSISALARLAESQQLASALVIFFVNHIDYIMRYERTKFLVHWGLAILELQTLIGWKDVHNCLLQLTFKREKIIHAFHTSRSRDPRLMAVIDLLNQLADSRYDLDDFDYDGRGRSLMRNPHQYLMVREDFRPRRILDRIPRSLPAPIMDVGMPVDPAVEQIYENQVELNDRVARLEDTERMRNEMLIY